MVAEVPDWEELREAGAAIKARALATLPEQLERLEAAVGAAGGIVHWARDAAEANAIVAGIAHEHGARELIKVKSLATDEIGLNDALAAKGVSAVETDLAELIIQLGEDRQSHILVPAIHRNREEIRALFAGTIATGDGPSSDPPELAETARRHLRAKFLSVPMAVSGANFGVAESGAVCVVESEGNGRFCTTLPEVLVTVMGIEKVLPEWRDLEVMLQLLPRSSTGERMNPYTSLWTGVTQNDGPREFHLVLLDNGRTDVLADEVGRQALRCIRCSACLNSCPVYSRTGGHAYESVYPGPIGAILTPQLRGLEEAPSLPWASSLCGACYEVCPVKIDIPSVLIHLRGRVVREERAGMDAEGVAMRRGGARVRVAPPLRDGAAAGPSRPRPAGAPSRRAPRRLDRHAGAAGGAGTELPRVVEGALVSAREEMLGRIRTALGPSPEVPEVPRDYRQGGEQPSGSEELAERFCERVAEYRATVLRTSPDELERILGEACDARGSRRLLAAPGVSWTVPGVEVEPDGPDVSVATLDDVDGALTGCALAIAETGTIVLDGSAACGRRALTLVPDHHVCVVRRDQIVAGVADAVSELEDAARGGRPITFVSGPSATSDIELERVEGVHGPRMLDVVVIG